ncbi:Phage DNA packaging protein, Nu1 subunit of terminase [uncultured Gammaproteobacteria bacterium]
MEHGESQRQFAQRIRLSQGRVTQLVKDGLPLLANGRIDVVAALQWLEQNLDQARSARAKGITTEPVPEPLPNAKLLSLEQGGPLVAQPVLAAPASPPAAPAVGSVTMSEARRQHEIVRVAYARLRFDKERGKLISKDEVKIVVFNRARKERNAHLGWIMRTSPLMAADLNVDPTLMFSVLDRYVREHLVDLANTPLLELPE